MTAALRSSLREAIAAADVAAAAARNSAEALARAGNAVAEAEARLAVLGDVDTRVAEHRAAALRSGAATAPLPAELAALRTDRAEAEAGLGDAARAAAILAGEHAEAEGAAARAAGAVRVAALRIAEAEAEPAARRLEALEKEAAALRADLSALRDSAVIGAEGQRVTARLAPWIVTMLVSHPVNTQGHLDYTVAVAVQRERHFARVAQWQDYLQRLQENPEFLQNSVAAEVVA